MLQISKLISAPFVYVDCGARGDVSNPLLSIFAESRYIGFDPAFTDTVEKEQGSSLFFPTALGERAGTSKFHRTRNPNCSSFFVPDQNFLDRFIEIGTMFTVEETLPLKVAALDQYLPGNGINDIYFIELDTQGSELDILRGAGNFLSSSVVGVRVEVGFSPMYLRQPLFADVDSFLQKFGFRLFDLEKYHLRRKTPNPDIRCREQIVWGQALFFRDLKISQLPMLKQKSLKLAMAASFYGFHSFAIEMLEHLLNNGAGMFSSADKDFLQSSYDNYVRSLTERRSARLLRLMKHFPLLRKLSSRLGSLFTQLGEKFGSASSDAGYFWKD